MNKIKVLVTASGGDIGQGVIRSLKMSGLNVRIITTEICAESSGLYLGNKGYVVSPVVKGLGKFIPDDIDKKGSISFSSMKFIDQIIAVCNEEKINIVFVCSEDEQNLIAKNISRLKKTTKSFFVVQPEKVIKMCQADKLITYKFLESKDIKVPETFSDRRDLGILVKKYRWPVVVKPRTGRGSEYFSIIHSVKEFNKAWNSTPKPLVQQYIGNSSNEEYTVGVFLDNKSKAIGAISFLRKLRFGMTWHASVSERVDVLEIAKRAAESVKAIGPCNVQVRIGSNNNPYIIEINARISSSTIMRAMFGYNEVAACIEYFLKGKIPKLKYTNGFAMRVFDAFTVSSGDYDYVKKHGQTK